MDDAPTRAAASDPTDRRLLAVQRLQLSRDALVDRWVERVPPRPTPPRSSSDRRSKREGAAAPDRGLGGWWDRWTSTPLGLLAAQALRDGWARSPWRLAGEAARAQWQHGVQPWVARHPALSSAVLLGAGVALIRLKPWAQPRVRRRLALGMGQARRALFRQIGREPWRSLWMAALAATLVQAEKHADHEGSSEATKPDDTSNSHPARREGEPHA